MSLRPVTVLLLLLVPMTSRAQEPDTLAAAAVSSLKSRPVTPAAEELYLPSQKAVSQTLADVVSRFTGVQVKDYGGAGGLKTVNVRSLGSEHVGVFLDDIQIDNAQNMQVDLGRFATEGLELISLYNGQKSVRLQTAREYASGASLHLESGKPSADALRLRIRGGSLGTVNPSLQWDKRLGSVALRASADFLGSNGRYRYPYFDTTRVRENGDINALRLETRLFGSTGRGEWRLMLYAYGSERGFPGPVIRRAAAFPLSAERQADQDLFAQGSWSQDWTPRYYTAVRFKYSNNYTHYNTHPEKNPMALPYDLHYRQQSGYLSVSQSFALTGHWSVDLSTDLQRNALDSDVGQFVTPRRTVFTGALATRLVQDYFRVAAHIAYVGAWDEFDTPSAGGWSREGGFRDAWMPSLSLSWTPLEWLEIDAFAKRSYRLPSFNDLYYSLMGNSNLVPESAVQAGMDLRAGWRRGPWRWELRLSPYYNRIEDKIVAIPTSSQFRWTMLNIGKVDVTGLDARASAGFERDGWNICATLRYSLQQALDHSVQGSQTWGNQIPYIPLHSGSAHLLATWRKWSFGWDTMITGERWSRSANTADYRIAPWTVSDASLSRDFTIGRSTLAAGLSLSNIFDYHYQIVQGYPMPGRCVYLNIGYGF